MPAATSVARPLYRNISPAVNNTEQDLKNFSQRCRKVALDSETLSVASFLQVVSEQYTASLTAVERKLGRNTSVRSFHVFIAQKFKDTTKPWLSVRS